MPENKDDKIKIYSSGGWLTGQMLIAMPSMGDPRFVRSVIYVCSHSANGAMGLVVNRLYGELNFRSLLEQLNLPFGPDLQDIQVHFGGPVEPGRGFVLHSSDYQHDGTMVIDDQVALTATVEILQLLANGNGPEHSLLALGYAGWGEGQLEEELQANGWLVAPADDEIIFDANIETKWERALTKIGISPLMLSADVGHA